MDVLGVIGVALVFMALLVGEIRARAHTPSPRGGLHSLRSSAMGAMIILGCALGASLFKDLGLWDGEQVTRSAGIVLGFVLMVTGNYLPKAPVKACTQAQSRLALRAQRRVGQIFLAVGAVSIVIWVAMPLAYAPKVTSGLGLVTFALAMIYGVQCWHVERRGA
ncbi:hypothetical protein [Woodsholea maritima]|uniref:hypothetical protein n=1 Tax=Woodsholea maritima TaxID=240237 RepID=UPI00039F0BA2|nr:hypothetical protein [Woodsholea maritima]